ncbi:FAD-binding oxidoreductase [Thermaerobacter subterraneus]|uniref:FAD/FMN-dependent dehydrogenase n=1 Tax=Thermaerobacter subterraneus DSM 13965 TaxID=867903 RepID=K6Q3P9_9FIRM|nr:FAD-binding protein [Thermaerobacter subterraneus]EKP95714.1 FAD/FMN-dependent dehydrogenase [Thermaerobacter subterraneus DSM 13965]
MSEPLPAAAPAGGPVARPSTLEELAALVREAARVFPRGGGTKAAQPAFPAGEDQSRPAWPGFPGPAGPGPAGQPVPAAQGLGGPAGDRHQSPEGGRGPTGVLVVDTTGLAGVVDYDPAEFTVTARAGTRVAVLEELLARHGQYLPFDPLLVRAGATLGGTVATGVSGPCRMRYGGVRDFVLGVTLVDGRGQVARGGGRVVKNAAGYDLPKFLCGSLGRFGILAELTFKVFPRPEAFATACFAFPSAEEAAAALAAVYRSPLEPHALEVAGPGVMMRQAAGAAGAPAGLEGFGQAYTLLVRVGGPAAILPAWVDRVVTVVGGAAAARRAEILQGEPEEQLWQRLRELAWTAAEGDPGPPVPAAGPAPEASRAPVAGPAPAAPAVPAAGAAGPGRSPEEGGPEGSHRGPDLLRLYSRPGLLPALDALLRRHGAVVLHTQAGTAAWALFPQAPGAGERARLLAELAGLGIPVLCWRGHGWASQPPPAFAVPPAGTAVARALKQVFDPHGRFLDLPWAEPPAGSPPG